MKNIVYFFCDELRVDALGCYGRDFAKKLTPNIDKIAKTGTVYTNCYCNSPLCVPSRTSIMTGVNPVNLGVLSNEAAFLDYHFENIYTTIPEEFQKNGYLTANFGKTHLVNGMHPFQIDNGEGSEMSFIKDKEESYLQLIKPQGCPTIIGGQYPDTEYFVPERVTDNAIDFLEKVRNPFFLRVSYLQPHTPVVPPKWVIRKCKDLELPPVDRQLPNTCEFERRFAEVIDGTNLTEEQIKSARLQYYSLVHWIDIQVGKILDTLEKKNLIEDTILVFHADHGVSLGENSLYAKHIFAPMVHKVPLIINQGNKRGEYSNQLCSGMDIAPTLCGLAGIPSSDQFIGNNLSLHQEAEYVYSIIGYGQPKSTAFPYKNIGEYRSGTGWPMRCCIRTKQYRLDKNIKINGTVVKHQDEDIFFCDYTMDPSEQINLVKDADYKDVIHVLSKKIDEFMKGKL